MTGITLDPISPRYREAVIDIFNYYVENSFAAYPERRVPYEFFDMLLRMSEGYPAVVARDDTGTVLGFGMLRPHSPFPTFARTAEITYFLRAEATGRGIGTFMLDRLVAAARRKGIDTILANASSLNPGSIRFHERNGFVECGRFIEIGRKKGQDFDVVWMEKKI